MAQIRIENIRKDFGDFTAVRESSFTVEDGMYREVFLEGDARVIYDGHIKPDALLD